MSFVTWLRNRNRIAVLAVLLAGQPAWSANINGHGRFEKIKGKPHMGYVELYETNLFLSPATSFMVGPSRRLGTTCQQGAVCTTSIITHDGCYCIDGLPVGPYSILMNQPLFFVAPKVVGTINLQAGQTLTVNPELPVDFSTYFKDSGQWTGAEPVWYQTYTATGTSVRGVTFFLAGVDIQPGQEYSSAEVAILKDNGNPNPVNWDFVGSRMEPRIDSGTDNWVRFRSGEIPTIPGTRYAVRISGRNQSFSGSVNFQPYKRNKDANSYVGGQAYNAAGVAQSFDLNYTVFSDNDGTLVTMNRRAVGLGYLCDEGFFGTQWGQTFIAQGQGLAGADVWAAGANHRWELDFMWKIRPGGPSGTQIGPTKITRAAYQTFGAGLHGVSYAPGEVQLIPGQTYYIEFAISNPPPDSNGFNPYLMQPSPGATCGGGESQDSYSGGMAFREGVARPNDDVSMTIVEYAVVGPLIRLSPEALSPTVFVGENLPNGLFSVENTGGGTLNYSISDNAGWLSVAPGSGSITAGEPPDPIAVIYSAAGLAVGTHQALITVSSPEAANSPQTLTVTITVETVKPDFDADHDVDMIDFAHLQKCLSGAGVMQTDPACADADFDDDLDVDATEVGVLVQCLSGAGVPAVKTCDD